MSAVYELGTGPEVWTVLNIDDVVGRLPMLLVPKGFSDELDLQLQPGATQPTQFEFSDPLALFIDEAESVRTCILNPTNDFTASTLVLQPTGEPNFGGAVDPRWTSQIREHGSVLLCAYTDIFLAAHVGEAQEPNDLDILRLLRTSMLGIIRVLAAPRRTDR
ncbi:hypothetical protein GCM10027421_32040 [Microbacterium shaanxiense]